jgi:hypothetical protein
MFLVIYSKYAKHIYGISTMNLLVLYFSSSIFLTWSHSLHFYHWIFLFLLFLLIFFYYLSYGFPIYNSWLRSWLDEPVIILYGNFILGKTIQQITSEARVFFFQLAEAWVNVWKRKSFFFSTANCRNGKT